MLCNKWLHNSIKHPQSMHLSSHTRHICLLCSLLDGSSPQFGAGVEELLVFVVSWVGISVALVCLVTCFTTLCCQGALWHTDHSTIHSNLWANLVITELLFIVGANRTQYTVRDLWLIQSRLYRKCGVMVDAHGVFKPVSRLCVPSQLACCISPCCQCFAGCVWKASNSVYYSGRCLKVIIPGESISTCVATRFLGWWWPCLQP